MATRNNSYVSAQDERKERIRAKKKRWDKIAKVILGLQALLSLIAVAFVVYANMLPAKYLLPCIIIVILLWVTVFLLIYMMQHVRAKKGKKKKCKAIGTTLSVFTMIVCILVTYYVGILNGTISSITSDQTVITHNFGVYVLDSDPAQELADVKDYSFGYASSNDTAYTSQAIEKINSELDSEVALTDYEDMYTMIDALLSKEIGCFVINQSYVDMLDDTEGYETTKSSLRMIWEWSVDEVVEEDGDTTELDPTKDCFVVYLSGSDTRSKKLDTSRSDVNILAFVNPTSHEVLLVSTPRDCWVQTTASSNGSYDKLTHCGLYGMDCSMDTLANFYDIDVNYYFQINFTGFETLVDAVDGVTVESDASFSSSVEEGAGVSFTKGTNYLNGKEALLFVRERHNIADGDFARSRHQMAVISALVDKLSSSKILTNYTQIMKSLEGMLTTSFSESDISSLVKMQLDSGASWHVTSYYITGEGGKEYTYSMPRAKSYVMYPDSSSVAKAKELIQMIYDGKYITDEDKEITE